ncbi:DUF1232 domain-containing protein [Paenibacillus sp. CMAA1739]|uniref:DUF1232 domain-containing protein n=1 Tax=Paenibacillus ottowii TaxID=2315729 RepID=UPI00272F13B5|nr:MULTISPECIES: DUF1232 domain-containing protein [Paenibacillus]MDP1512755.1 DUF1232 domain-containing protein [Paenibacillus ottowii]MEC4568766.1 DUF1232 domain-containing protein [Paenibacillus sp. CMAA1739]
MSDEKRNVTLGETLVSLLKERSLSMRKLSAATGIDTATISRIVNGKQRAKPEHLEAFALHLDVPSAPLFQAAGYGAPAPPIYHNQSNDIFSSINSIKETLQASNLMDHQFTAEQVQKELSKYEPYVLTEEGARIIHNDFPGKVKSVNGAGPFIEELKRMYQLYSSDNITSEERSILGSGLLYFVSATDIIPDYVFPLGYLDDAIAVQIVLNRLQDTRNNKPQP